MAKNISQSESNTCLAMGNHAIARAIVESGTRVITSYPGSPTPEIGAALTSVPKAERSFYFEFSVNEKVALEIAAGASLNGHLSCVFFKSVGLNVASDSLIQQSLMNHIGGLVIVLGDDPGANSSQNEQDNRHFSRMSYIPMLEPASPKEAYELYLEAARISREKQMPVFLRLTTNVCHARQLVSFGGLIRDNYSWPSRYHRDNGPYFPVTKDVFPLKNNALKKLETLQSTANRLVRQYSADTRTGLGVISCGLPALETLEVSEAAGNKVSVLQLQMTWPLPKEAVLAFLSAHNEVVVIEELDRVMETEIKAMAFDAGCTVCIYSRPSSEIMGELSRHRILKILSSIWPDHFSASRKKTYETFTELPPRPPQLCPGCGHRSAFFAASDILDDTSIVVGDIGCLTLGALPPHHMGDILFSMGHSVSTAQGLALKNPSRNVLALMGDGTFFHAGIPGVINAVANQSNITLYLLDNATTAMTGHQSRPGNGEIGEKINIPALLKSLGVGFIRQADAYNQTLLKQYLQEAFEYDGFAVVIARHPCMLKLTRANRRKDPLFQLPPVTFSAPPDDVDEKRILAFGCPSFQRGPNGEMTVNEEMCIGCGACLPVSLSGVIQRGAPVRASGKER